MSAFLQRVIALEFGGLLLSGFLLSWFLVGTVITELQVLVAPVKFNLLSLGRLLGRSWTVDFIPNFKVEPLGTVFARDGVPIADGSCPEMCL